MKKCGTSGTSGTMGTKGQIGLKIDEVVLLVSRGLGEFGLYIGRDNEVLAFISFI